MSTVTAQPTQFNVALLNALEGEHAEAALEQAFSQLAHGGTLQLILAMTKALVRIGVAGLAVRLLQAGGDQLLANPQIADLVRQLRALPTGEISASERLIRLGHNVEKIKELVPQCVTRLKNSQSVISEIQAFRSHKGNIFVIRNQSASKLEFVFPFSDQVANIHKMKWPELSLSTSFLLLGVPNAALWTKLLSFQLSNGYGPPIDIIETDENVFAIWLQLVDNLPQTNSGRIEYVVGNSAFKRYRDLLIQNPWRTLPPIRITSARPQAAHANVASNYFDEIDQIRCTMRAQAKQKLDLQYSKSDIEYWKQRFRACDRSGSPLRVIGFSSRYSTVIQHSLRDLGKAFRKRNCQFELAMQPNNHTATVPVLDVLSKANADLIVVIDHLRCEFQDSMPANVPYVCWVQDHMDRLCSKDAGQSVTELDLVIGHSAHVMAALYKYPLARFIESNNLTDADTYNNAPIGLTELEPYLCDVSFVSHGAATAEELVEEISQGGSRELKTLFQCFLSLIRERVERQGWANSYDLVELMLEAERQSKHPELSHDVRRSKLYPQVARIYDRVYRHGALEWVARWAMENNRKFRIYGRGWERNTRFREFAAGEIESGELLRRVYHSTQINLQINSYGSMHQRLLDGIATGSFMLCRYNPFDFIREPFARIQKIIQLHELKSLSQLLELREQDESLHNACCMIETLCKVVIRKSTDPQRRVHIETLRKGNRIEDMLTDEGLFSVLAEMRCIPTRVASDLPGFANVVFHDEQSLNSLLNRYIDHPEARRALICPMRESVIQHDTYDGLVNRILTHFRGEV